MRGIQYLNHLTMSFKIKTILLKLLKLKINLTLICYTLAHKLTIPCDIKAI